tara:strand:- start:961 stop:1752 length:792 start_codon:yes stop_codon:yes gene_type:complete
MNKNFFSSKDSVRKSYYQKEYVNNNKSWAEIAKELKTYSNKVRRDATKLGVSSRDKSAAQKIAISSGRTKHPTEGKVRDDATKQRISESQGRVWDNLTDEERLYRSEIGKDSWDKKTEEEKKEFFQKSAQAIQKASKEGSITEIFLFKYLTEQGLKVYKHKEQILQNEKFHIDLYIPSHRTAIEIDGPVHFEPIFGQEKLMNRQAADLSKNGLILSEGLVLIRVKLNKRMSQRYLRIIQKDIMDVLDSVKENFPKENERYFEL